MSDAHELPWYVKLPLAVAVGQAFFWAHHYLFEEWVAHRAGTGAALSLVEVLCGEAAVHLATVAMTTGLGAWFLEKKLSYGALADLAAMVVMFLLLGAAFGIPIGYLRDMSTLQTIACSVLVGLLILVAFMFLGMRDSPLLARLPSRVQSTFSVNYGIWPPDPWEDLPEDPADRFPTLRFRGPRDPGDEPAPDDGER